jgi:hypothetical protein
MSRRPYTIAELLAYYQGYSDAALWEEERAASATEPRVAERARWLAEKLTAQAKGYLFQARDIAYEANGGRK